MIGPLVSRFENRYVSEQNKELVTHFKILSQGQKLVYVGKVMSIDIPKSRIFEHEMSLKIPDAMMKSLCEKNTTTTNDDRELFPYSYKFVAKIVKTKDRQNMFENNQI